jgi:hypothetical protein
MARPAMPSLKELAQEPAKRTAVIDEACRVLDLEVADKSGLSGMAIKAGYKLVQGVKPGFIREVVDNLLDDFLDALDPIYTEARAQARPPGEHLKEHSGRMHRSRSPTSEQSERSAPSSRVCTNGSDPPRRGTSRRPRLGSALCSTSTRRPEEPHNAARQSTPRK